VKEEHSDLLADINLTAAAQRRLQVAIAEQGGACNGVRISVKPGGCSGFEYVMDYDAAPQSGDYVRQFDGFSVYIDTSSYQVLEGLVLDYEEGMLASGFSFSNPNKKGECGCGASFYV